MHGLKELQIFKKAIFKNNATQPKSRKQYYDVVVFEFVVANL